MLRSFLKISQSLRSLNSFPISSASFSTEAPSKQDVDDLFAERPQGDFKRRHAFSVNKVELIGGVALDPLLKTGKNDKPFLLFNIITNHSFKQADGNTIDRTERHSVTVFGKQAEALSKIIKRGTRLSVTGRLHYTGGIKDESGNYTPRQTHIIANNVQTIARTPREHNE